MNSFYHLIDIVLLMVYFQPKQMRLQDILAQLYILIKHTSIALFRFMVFGLLSYDLTGN